MSVVGPALVDGVILATLYGLLATGVVIIFNTSGVINFAQGAIAIFSVFVMKTVIDHGAPFFAGALVAVLVGAGIGVLIDRLTLAPIRSSSSLNKAIVTIGWLITLQALAVLIFNAGVSTNIPRICDTCGNQLFNIGGLGVNAQDVVTIAVTLGLGVALTFFFRVTYAGVAMRAAAQDANATRLMGVSVNNVSAFAWALGGALATVGGILVAPKLGALDAGTLTLYLIQAFAAALLGGLRSLPRTALGALALGIIQSLVSVIPGTSGLPGLKFTTAFVFIVLALFLRPDLARTAVQATSERVMATVKTRWWTYTRMAAMLAIAVFFVYTGTSTSQTGVFGSYYRLRWAQVFADACILASLVVLVGFVGQISLCQVAFAGFGAYFSAIFVTDWGIPFYFALPLAALATAPIGAVIGIPALRIRGLQLAVVTLAFALVCDQLFFAQSFPLSGGPAGRLLPAQAGPVDFASDDTNRQMYWIFLGTLLLVSVGVAALKRSPSGRAFFAVRDSENAATAVGVSLTRIKLSAFALAAGIAALGGGLYGLGLGTVSSTSFNLGQSIQFLALVILAGIRSVWGALVGAAFLIFAPILLVHILGAVGLDSGQASNWELLLSGVLLIVTIIANPRGIIGGLEEIPARVMVAAQRWRSRRASVPPGAEVA
jgi:branched-chain amino acid transport system permease protein